MGQTDNILNNIFKPANWTLRSTEKMRNVWTSGHVVPEYRNFAEDQI